MYLGALSCKIEIGGKYILRGLESLVVKKSVHTIMQSATLTLPLSYVIRNKNLKESVRLIDKIKEGDAIKINVGYNSNNILVFSGYIKRINPKQPLELELEDEMYLLKKLLLKKSFVKASLKEVLTYITDECFKKTGVRFQVYDKVPGVEIKNFIIDNKTALWALEQLRELYLMHSFLLPNNIFYCGLAYGYKGNEVKYRINHNTISIDELKITEAKRLRAELTITKADGTIKTYKTGDENAEDVIKKTINASLDDATAEALVKGMFEEKHPQGYKGKFVTFFYPMVNPTDHARLMDTQFESRSGNYYVSGVELAFGTNGSTRTVEIDFKMTN